MTAVFRREFRSFFASPIGYAVLALLLAVSGYYFTAYNLTYLALDLSGVFSALYTVSSLLVLPILTMRLFSEEKRQKTDQALLTAPVSLTGAVIGKFLSALLVFAIGISVTLVYAIVLATAGTPEWLMILGNYLGLLLFGGMIIAAGLLFSCLTESQLVAALCTFTFSLLLNLIDSLTSLLPSSKVVEAVVGFLSVSTRYQDFVQGTIQYDNILFFLSMQVLFLFLAVRVLDRRRWN